MTDSATDRKRIRELEKRAKADHERTGNVIRTICSTEQGRRFLWDQLDQCSIFTAIYPSHPNLGAVLGERNVGLRLLALVTEFCPAMFIKMMEETNARRALDAAAAAEHDRSEDSGRDVDGPEPSLDDYTGIYRDPGSNPASH